MATTSMTGCRPNSSCDVTMRDAALSQDMMPPQPLAARAEGGTHDGEKFDISEETVGLLLNSRRNATVLEYYEVVLYMGGNLLAFVRDYDAAEWRGAIASRPASTGPA